MFFFFFSIAEFHIYRSILHDHWKQVMARMLSFSKSIEQETVVPRGDWNSSPQPFTPPLFVTLPILLNNQESSKGKECNKIKKGRSSVSTPLLFGTGGTGERQHEGGLWGLGTRGERKPFLYVLACCEYVCVGGVACKAKLQKHQAQIYCCLNSLLKYILKKIA